MKQQMKTERSVPVAVRRLRSQLDKTVENPDSRHPTTVYSVYKYRDDPKLRAMIGEETDPHKIIQIWMRKTGFSGQHGQKLISGFLQDLLCLELRQVLVWGDEVYKINLDLTVSPLPI